MRSSHPLFRPSLALLGAGLCLSSVAQAAPPAPPTWQSAPPAAAVGCVERPTGDAQLDELLRGLQVRAGEETRPITTLRIEGTRQLDAAKITAAMTDAGKPIDGARAAAIVRELVGSGLFAQVRPVIELPAGATGATLVLQLVEHATVARVVFEGITEQKPEGLLEALLRAPKPRTPKDQRDRRGRDAEPPACPRPEIPAASFARADHGAVTPGIVWKGVAGGLDRVLEQMFERGYRMASLSAQLQPDGTLRVRIDEGRIKRVEVRGLAAAVTPEAVQRLALEPGRIFVEDDLDDALRRVQATLPFVRAHDDERVTRERPRVQEVIGDDGSRSYRLRESEPAPPAERERPAWEERLERMLEDLPHGLPGLRRKRTWYTVAGDGTLVLHLRTRAGDLDVNPVELVRHTPVTGFAPGLEAVGRFWDAQNRAHLRIDVAGNVNTERAREPMVDPAQIATRQRWRVDGLVGASLQVPRLRMAELGGRIYTRVDTFDRWRISPIDSYLYSALINRPEADYFHRSGATAFATAHLFDRLTAGLEYRRDRYHTLASRPDVPTLFNRDEAAYPTAPVTNGTMASLVMRLEWSTLARPAHAVGAFHRDPEKSLVNRNDDTWWAGFRTVNTLELARPGLGGDDQFRFAKVVSDSAAFLPLQRHQGFRLRFRAAGRLGHDPLPLQKEEALGGWSALRGYGFKELGRGDFSLLGTVEYRVEALSAFADVGAVRVADDWSPTRVGVGLALNLGDDAQLAIAWRTDDRADWLPEARLLFQRTF